jgi:hypothetical protein
MKAALWRNLLFQFGEMDGSIPPLSGPSTPTRHGEQLICAMASSAPFRDIHGASQKLPFARRV